MCKLLYRKHSSIIECLNIHAIVKSIWLGSAGLFNFYSYL